MVQLHLCRARTGCDTRKASLEILRAVQTVLGYTHAMGWSIQGDG